MPSSEERIRNRQQPDDQHQGHHQPPEHQVVAVGDLQQVVAVGDVQQVVAVGDVHQAVDSNHQDINNSSTFFTFFIKLFRAYLSHSY